MLRNPTPYQQNYVQYNNREEIKELDKNVWDSSYGVIADGATGRHLYVHEPRHPAYYTCFPGRDPETHYIIGRDRDEHPDHSSRFGYARCPNGYCSGHFPGKYNESDMCCGYDAVPSDMAPERFYDPFYQDKYTIASQAIIDYDYMKNYGMNLNSWWKYPGEPKDRL